ncbi:hypothetical protein AKJ65_07180 [candidate division MSBL1 archaeon SCGC-AAA259E19]|uniref:N-acetyltransferase domain-containing protein n=1 Tax=candidate division MSBL1 archaeon SCGC-AAA259E19 TaxID=1698264 RepID=A0A133UES4_9EURY|nr:hypothetical protein AKJ65_07180 [candidate division MSBL1 archaeon SCGC-AAA259E19]
MEIVKLGEIEDWQMTELTLACFDHTFSAERARKEAETDPRLPDWGGMLYAKEKGRVLGSAGMIYPRAKTKDGIERIGGIHNVCSRPSEARKGTAKKLLKELHQKMRNNGIRYSILHASRKLVAHNLYRELGYKDLYRVPMAYRKTNGKKSNIALKKEKDPQFVKSLYEKSVEGLYGLIVREDCFWNLANVRGFPENDNLRIAYEGDERIGYALFETSRKHSLVEEISAKERTDIPRILEAIENESSSEYIAINRANPNYRDILEECGFRYYDDRWERMMIKNLKGPTEDAIEAFNSGERVHTGPYEHY